MSLIRVTQVGHTYDLGKQRGGGERKPQPVLKNVNLNFAAGQTTAIVGISGCGKSTLLKTICGILRPTEGKIEIAAGDTYRMVRGGDIALMPQSDGLFPWENVLDNLILAARIHGSCLKTAREDAQNLLETFGLGPYCHYWPQQLSGGMRSRVSFLRTLMAQTPAIALDEPFGSLDAITRENAQNWLKSVMSSRELTLILVTHDIDEAMIMADRVVVMGRATTDRATSLTVFDAAKIHGRNQAEYAHLRAQIRASLADSTQGMRP
ncbi:ATP-binding cassette domain-containing protein [Actinomycetaceae bacterium TAE3-ERU4]|nr:ATP-binding cassette domain-containing protein [Actinomycetaceae bacterium TAE3-ERU4]